MKQLKFRVWDKEFKKFYFHGFGLTLDGVLTDSDGCWKGDFDTNYVIQQYFGRKDENGQDLYEGDIIKSNIKYQDMGKIYHTRETLFEIQFGLDEWIGVEIEKLTKIDPNNFFYNGSLIRLRDIGTEYPGYGRLNCEIIGNIFQYPV